MEAMQEIYREIAKTNPIDNKEYLEKLINFYKISKRTGKSVAGDPKVKKHRENIRGGFYQFVTGNDVKNLDNTKVNAEEYEKFYIKMTNKWIQNIKSLNDKQIEILKQYSLDGYEYIKQMIQQVEKVYSMKEIEQLYNQMANHFGGKVIEEKKYFWRHSQGVMENNFDALNDYADTFTHISSNWVNTRKEKEENVEYRLYINCANEDIFKIVNEYVDLCEKNNLTYYFKFFPDRKGDDRIVFFCSKNNLLQNIEILKQIERNHPEIVNRCGKSLDLIGKIDDMVGIASEPDKKENKYGHSFNTLRAEILEDAAEKLTLDYIKSRLSDKTKDITNFYQELLDRATDVVIEEMKEQTGNPALFTPNYISQLKKALLFPINNRQMKYLFYGFEQLEAALPHKNDFSILKNTAALFTLKMPNGEKFEYSLITADKVLKSMVEVMQRDDENYLSKYSSEIKKRCEQYGVDPNNFSLNSSSLEDFKQIDSFGINLSLDSDEKVNEQSKQQDNEYSNWNKENFYYVKGILSTLSPDDLKLRIPLPNGIEISLEQYAEEYLVSRMDGNQNFITDTGEYIPVVDVIMGYARNKTIDKVQTYEEVSNWNITNFNYVQNILSTLSPEDLKMRIPNSNFSPEYDLTLEQYAQEYLVSRMDENHNFITNTGELIPVDNLIRDLVEQYSNQQESISQTQDDEKEIITDASQWSTNFSRTIH